MRLDLTRDMERLEAVYRPPIHEIKKKENWVTLLS